jgi:hypothetical protein
MFAMMHAPTGETMSPKNFQRSVCGEQFDEYVFRELDLFPWSLVGGASREVKDLWDGRRLKIHYNGSWREGRVCGWKQFNPESSTFETKWKLELELDTFKEGDVVNMSISGTACNDEKGACVIKVPLEGETKDIVIKPANVVLPRMNLEVNRINVEGGGTLKVEGGDTSLISLEWLEPASPSMNKNADMLSFECPYCRASEPVLVACEAPAHTKKDECPICLETTECRVLECGHRVCHSCWSSCRKAAMYGSVHFDDLDSEEVQTERAERYRLFKKKRTRGASRDDFAKQRFAETFAEIVEEASDSEQGLVRLKRELMVEHPALWLSYDSISDLYDQLPIAGLKIVLHMIEERMAEILEAATGAAICKTTFYLCSDIASRYREAKNYLVAVPWAELSLFYTKQLTTRDRTHLSISHHFAALAQRDADLLSKSLENYDASLLVMSENHQARRGRENLIRQMEEQWTGSSGELTPGC